MDSSTRVPVDKLVTDANAFLKNAKIQALGSEIYSLREVVSEIRDSATKQRLQVLPYELHFKIPTTEAIRIVTEFSKKTGDYSSLSATDLKLIALTYQLEVEAVGSASHLKTEPAKAGVDIVSTQKVDADPRNIVGFHASSNLKSVDEEKSDTTDKEENIVKFEDAVTEPNLNSDQANQNQSDVESVNHKIDNLQLELKKDPSAESAESESSEEVTDSEEEETDSSDGESDWITPDNFKEAILQMGGDAEALRGMEDGPQIPVACLTSDFAMQNVLLHIGLKVVSLDGLLVKRLRTYVLRCYACFKTTGKMTLKFCPSCGNSTLKRVAISVDPNTGSTQIHLSRRRKPNAKGKRFSLPMPKGGKHGFDPILCADQPVPHNRLSKKAQGKINPFDPDYVTKDSPFALNDVNSRSSLLGLGNHGRTGGRKNPNFSGKGKKRGGKRN